MLAVRLAEVSVKSTGMRWGITRLVGRALGWVGRRGVVRRAREAAQRWRKRGGTGLRAALLLLALLPAAAFMHLAFRHSYLPRVAHSRPLHFTFRTCEQKGMCSYPSAHVKLTKRHQLLMVGQSYKMTVNLEMPESEVNKNLGMFMCCAEMRSRKGHLTASGCRSGMLLYRSPLFNIIYTIVMSPFMILGYQYEKQMVAIELFSNLEDDQNQPITDIHVEIQSMQVELYSASLHIDAHFTGLRHILYHWPYVSALIGTSTNLFFMLLICLLSWYHLHLSNDEGSKVLVKADIKPMGGGTENYLFDTDDPTLEAEDIKEEEDSEDVKIVETRHETIHVE